MENTQQAGKQAKRRKAEDEVNGGNDNPKDGVPTLRKPSKPAAETISTEEQILKLVFPWLLEVSDLLNCSLVSKKWNEISRKILRESRRVRILIENAENVAELKELNALLNNMVLDKNFPFNGIRFRFTDNNADLLTGNPKDPKKKIAAQNIEVQLQKIFNSIPLKYVLLESQMYDRTPVSEIFKFYFPKLPFEQCECFETRCIIMDWPFFASTLENRKFSNLKVLETSNFSSTSMDETYIEEILNACPAMQEWWMTVYAPDVVFFVHCNKVHLVKKLEVTSFEQEEEIEVMESNPLELRMLHMSFTGPHFRVEDSLCRILRHSQNSLRGFQVPFSVLSDFVNSSFPPLNNVKVVDAVGGWRDRRAAFLQRVYTKFPKAERVEALENPGPPVDLFESSEPWSLGSDDDSWDEEEEDEEPTPEFLAIKQEKESPEKRPPFELPSIKMEKLEKLEYCIEELPDINPD